MSTVWVQRVLDWVLFMPCNMRCTQYTVLKSHAVLLTHAVQSPTDRYGYARTAMRLASADGPRPSSTPTSTTYGTATLSASRSTTYTVHTFPRPVSISHVQPYTDSAAGRPDSDTRQRAVGYDTQLTGACLSTMLSTQFRCNGTPPRPRARCCKYCMLRLRCCKYCMLRLYPVKPGRPAERRKSTLPRWR